LTTTVVHEMGARSVVAPATVSSRYWSKTVTFSDAGSLEVTRFEDQETIKALLTFTPTTHSVMELGAMIVRGGSEGVARVMVKSGESPVTVGDAASYAEN
jgi:hypothetical protein